MQEEVTQKTIALVIKTARLDANTLKAAMKMYLDHRRQKNRNGHGTHGKTSVKKLIGEGAGVSSIEITDGNIKSFERTARKYNIDFAVKKDKTAEPPKYVVFFKGKDAEVVSQAFKEFVYGNEKKKQKTSVREKLKRFKEAAQNKNKERSLEKDKEKDRGRSL
ncbi:MAG: PcfB family protein [Lachnospiraceae bacterium]|nr:PcfB family protein [Lachnospiraceae bacterium]